MMIFVASKIIFVTILIDCIQTQINLDKTHDEFQIEAYDCFYYESLEFCRRPRLPIDLLRDGDSLACNQNNGILHRFSVLKTRNLSLTTIIQEWGSSLDRIEDYARFLQDSSVSDRFICQCHERSSFGKNCEYQLPVGVTLVETMNWKSKIIRNQNYNDILCYETLSCDADLLCLDWRDICDGIQQCMFGYDEQNCDILEMNICHEDEYRCSNGMCIPDDYFLGGDRDCLDWSDEINYKLTIGCARRLVSTLCDDHICLSYKHVSGDDTCSNSLVTSIIGSTINCDASDRLHYFICEPSSDSKGWTISNDICYWPESSRERNYSMNDISEDRCRFISRCGVSQGAHIRYPCSTNGICSTHLNRTCPTSLIQYPSQSLVTAYIRFFYLPLKDIILNHASIIVVNGTVKCRNSLIDVNFTTETIFPRTIQHLMAKICSNVVDDINANALCHNANESTDICHEWNPCMSVTRLNDGFINCLNKHDERYQPKKGIGWSCARVYRHRFRCSDTQETCLSILNVGNGNTDCENQHDEFWEGGYREIKEMKCNIDNKDDCYRLRQYIEQSWITKNISDSLVKRQMPFRFYCNTIWNLDFGQDENVTECHDWWKCYHDQEVCDRVQCLDMDWGSDLDRDCADGTDIKMLYTSPMQNVLEANQRNKTQQNSSYLLRSTCHSESSFFCLSPHLLIPQFFCLNQSQIGNGVIDCAGAFDEINTLPHCSSSSVPLGNNFLCLSTNTCIPYFNLCEPNHRCPNRSDDESWCTIMSNPVQCPGRFYRCDEFINCPLGEDEYMCDYATKTFSNIVPYRAMKLKQSRTTTSNFYLPRFPPRMNISKSNSKPSENSPKLNDTIKNVSISSVHYCNRGLMIWSPINLKVCFCPPQYYGDRCQYQADRLLIMLHIDLSRSIYSNTEDLSIILHYVVIVLFEKQIKMKQEFYLRPALELEATQKRLIYFVYSHSNQSQEQKRRRYINRSAILQYQPYSIRIDAYERHGSTKLSRLAVWHYPIFFDYLPVYHFAKTLRLEKFQHVRNPCLNHRCPSHQQCQPLMNKPMEYLCVDPIHICPVYHYGRQCEVKYNPCESNPCLNGGTCLPTERIDRVQCACRKENYGELCQFFKAFIRLSLKTDQQHELSVVQFFDIDPFSLDLILVHQQLHSILPPLIEYYRQSKFAPVIVLTKLYSSSIDLNPKIYLLSLYQDVFWVQGQTNISSINQCLHIHHIAPGISPIGYHYVCEKNVSLICFRDDVYVCFCADDHNRVECFLYDMKLDECSHCLVGGRCFKGDYKRMNDFRCFCPPCSTGRQCQFSTKSFTFTLDYLFYTIIISHDQQTKIYVLLSFVFLTFFIGSINNICSFLTFRRKACLVNGVGHYLYCLTIINQMNLVFFLLRFIHIFINVTTSWNTILCRSFHYLLLSSSRIVFWLSSLIAIERVYTTIFLNGRWLKQPRIAHRLMILSSIGILSAAAYEIIFYRSFIMTDDSQRSMCVFEFPIDYQSIWMICHLLISTVSILFPILINLCSTVTIGIVVVRNKMKTLKSKEQQYVGHRFRFILHVLREHKELMIGPGVTLIPQLFSLPYFIASFIFDCRNIDDSWIRYLLMISYWTSFIPQIIGFFLYVSPSSLYSDEWRKTKISQWINSIF